MIFTTYPYHVVLVQKKKKHTQKDNERGTNYPGLIKMSDSSRGHITSTRDGSVIDSDSTYKFWNMDRSSHGVFVSKNQTKSVLPPSTTRARARFTPAIFPLSELPTPQDYQPHPLVPNLAASTFTFGALPWRYRELKFKF
jgi:hypothetical protein